LNGCKRGTKQGLGGRGRAGGSHTATGLALLGAGEGAAALGDSIIRALVHSVVATDDLAEHCDAGGIGSVEVCIHVGGHKVCAATIGTGVCSITCIAASW
jgi:hypothetical protein